MLGLCPFFQNNKSQSEHLVQYLSCHGGCPYLHEPSASLHGLLACFCSVLSFFLLSNSSCHFERLVFSFSVSCLRQTSKQSIALWPMELYNSDLLSNKCLTVLTARPEIVRLPFASFFKQFFLLLQFHLPRF